MATTLRNIRIDDPLWDAAKAACEARGTDVSAEVRGFLERLVRNHERQTENK